MSAIVNPADFLRKHSPNETFIFSASGSYTYSDSLSEIENYSAFITAKLSAGLLCGIAGKNSADTIFILMACWMSGIIPVLLNIRLTPEEMDKILSFSGCSFLFIEQGRKHFNPDFPFRFFPSGANSLNQVSEIREQIIPNETDTAAVIFTSGSTGKPKGVELSFKTIADSALLQDKFLRQKEGEKWLASLPFYHVGGLSIISRCLYNGCSIVLPESLKTGDLISAAEKFEVQYLSIVGTQLKAMLEEDFQYGSKIKNILLGGGFTDLSIVEKALLRNWNISSVYGSSETSSFIAAAGPGELKKYPGSTAKELIPRSIKILDDNYNLLPAGTEGEIALTGVPLFKGYLKDPERTSGKFHGEYFLTGDVGYLNDEGFLFVKMRRTDLIISGGENIDPREVENAIRKFTGVDDVYVFGVPDVKWGQLCAAVLAGPVNHSPEEIKNLLSRSLAGYKIPKKIYFLQSIPRNDLGKVMHTEVLTRLHID